MSEAAEAIAFENAVNELRAEGFDVSTRPSGLALPAFLNGYTPDAIAVRDNEKLVIEVITTGETAKRKFDKIQNLVSQSHGWKLRAIWVDSIPDDAIDRLSRKDIEDSILSVKSLIASGNLQPALLMAWATFEALGRAIAPDKFRRPQTPGRLVNVLATAGQLTPGEADRLRALATMRNKLIHGGLQQPVSANEIVEFVRILETLSGFVVA